MKGIYQALMLVYVATIILVIGFGENVTATDYKLFEVAQTSVDSSTRILEVALPESAVVGLITGNSYTGQLTAFNSTNLTISASDDSRSIPLNQVRQVEFQGDVWIPDSDGQLGLVVIRGYPVPFSGVPIAALELTDSPSIARLHLTDVLSNEEFARLSRDSNKIYVVTKILFESSETMEVTVKAVRRQLIR